jgi:hypothetical protein
MATRANIELEIVSRASAWMTAAGLAVTTVGTNASLNSPIAWAIRTAGGTVSNPALVADADVATVASADYDFFLDLAELRTLENILANFSGVDKKAGPVELKSSQLGDRIAARIAYLRASLAAVYSYGGYGAFSVTLTRSDGYTDLQAGLE